MSKTAFLVSALFLLGTACATATIADEEIAARPPTAAVTPPDGGPSTSCAPGKMTCGTECVDLQTSPDHCGSCDLPCSGTTSCVRGTCGSTSSCGAGRTACDSKCVDLLTDAANCGACGHTCGADAGAACKSGACPGELRVRVLIDGDSQLVFAADKVKWHVIRAAAPGLWNGHNDATFLDTSPWMPAWPKSGDNRDCNCDSQLSPPVPALGKIPQTVTMKLVAGRGNVTIAEQPSAANNFALKVTFSDPPDGAAWYEVVLNYLSN